MAATRPYERKSARLPKAERQQQLLDVAERLFIQNGYERTTIEDIAQAAGVSRPVVYNNHGSKEGVYLACVQRARDTLDQQLTDQLSGVTDPREQLRIAGEVFFTILEQDPDRWLVLFGGTAVPLFGELGDKLTALRFRTVERTAERIQRTVPGLDPEAAHAAAHAISGVGEQLGRWWIDNPTIPRDRLVEYYTELQWNGLANAANRFTRRDN